MQNGVPIPEPYSDPEANWPFRGVSYEDARGWVSRIRAEGSHEGKEIAREIGLSWSTVKRAVRWYLISVQEYTPETWLPAQRQRKAEARRWFLEKMAERDQQEKNAHQEIRQARAEIINERATRDLHIASSHSEEDERRERRRQLQRRLNAKNRSRL